MTLTNFPNGISSFGVPMVGGGGFPKAVGKYFFVDVATGANGNSGEDAQFPLATITAALAKVVAGRGDVIYVAPGNYDESVVINSNMNDLIMVGLGTRGAAAIAPSTPNPVALTIDGVSARARDITIINMGCEGSGTGAGLRILGNTRVIRLHGCKIEGGDDALIIESNGAGVSVGDTRVEDCELAWTATAVHIKSTGGSNPVTQTYFRNCLLHNFSSRGIHVDTVHSPDLWVEKCSFARQEDGSAPTNEFVLASVASTTGLFTDNSFAHPTNASAKLAIATGVLWVANKTEAGISAARPA
jgi:pectin methylesterase-like acyl-CoA thioesterase